MSDDNELQDITGPLYQQYESLILQKETAGSLTVTHENGITSTCEIK